MKTLIFAVVLCMAVASLADHHMDHREGGHHPPPRREGESEEEQMPEDKPEDMGPGVISDGMPEFLAHLGLMTLRPGCKMPEACTEQCPNGRVTDDKGCPTCQCLENACADLTCNEEETCRLVPCFTHPCTKLDAKCIYDSVCHIEAEHKKDMKKMLGEGHVGAAKIPVPTCTSEGHYEPMQCHQESEDNMSCWCVDAYGKYIDGTKYQVVEGEDPPECIAQRTTSLTVSFTMTHELVDGVEEHIPKIKSLMYVELSRWMLVKPESINQLQIVEIGEKQLMVSMKVIATEDQPDLSNAAHKLDRQLKNKCTSGVDYEGTKLTPQKHTLKMEHEDKGEREETWKEWGKRKCRGFTEGHRGKKLLIILGVAGCIALIVLIVLVVKICRVVKYKRGQFAPKPLNEKSLNYKENIAFSNELYFNGDEKKGTVLGDKQADPLPVKVPMPDDE